MKIRSPYENVKFTSVFNKFKTINFFKKKNLTLFDVGANKSFNKIGIIIVSILFYDFYKKKRISFFYIEKIIKKDFIFYDLAHLYKNPKNNSIDHVEVIYVNKNLL